MKLLIVEDEAPVRKHMKWMLEGSGIELWEAENGREALDVLEQNSIDIMLTDIRMPIIDGIELIQQCKLLYPRLWSIVLSNYAEFDLAQMALRYGAKNYLLKATICKESLVTELNRAYEYSQSESLEKGRLDSNEMLMLQNSLFYEWLHQRINTAELIKRSMKLNVQVFQFEETQSMFTLLEVDRFTEWCASKFNCQADLAIYAFMNVAVEVIKQFHPKNELFHLENARFILLDFGECNREKHDEKMKGVQLALQQFLKLESSLITGYDFTTMDSFIEKVRHSVNDMTQLFYCMPACLISHNERESTSKDIDLYSFFQNIEVENEKNYTLSSNLPMWIESFFDLVRYLKRQPSTVKEDLKFLISFIEKKGYSVTEDLKTEISRKQAYRLNDYKIIFEQWLNDYHYMGTHRIEIVEALNYIHEHYSNKFTVDDICNHINISRSHFSKLFKEHQGVSVIEYVEGVRMKQARVLLRTTPLTISEIADRIGVQDIFYFSKLYKKYYKVSPSKDRSML
ncbi:AraC family transcriptional regulator [Paenibacillus alba]|uniref:response regulator transcription factor n=1 Tax=Paenibacillus alba TaxID=1197127 RepID=UPI00156335AE|nr:AraC family transcriptional regulator [Paenibacillus alba]NQX67219.1 AraC family transcriptional regulator [Paenibacillus alba]